MSIEVKVPMLPESVADATIATWHKKVGDAVQRDENIVDLETDKVVLEVPAPEAGIIEEIICIEGDTVNAEQVIARIKAGAVAADTAAEPKSTTESTDKPAGKDSKKAQDDSLSPSVRRIVAEHDVDVSQVSGSGKGGRITKADVKAAMSSTAMGLRAEERVPMSRLRARIAERLLEAQQNAAILTTFNEVNMQPVMELRKKYKDLFEKKHGVRLGFMSFFAKAVIEALQRFPAVNASIDGNDVVYHGYCDIGVAVSSPRGLVVPILRNAENMSMAEIEAQISAYGQKAKEGKLTVEDMTGGTFTLSNGGVFGSLLSTPIINPPQSAILGMHKIEDRPVVENGEIVIRPMMYLALSYDHRIIDGKESVSFLVAIKEALEDPARLLLGV
ncbi:MAG: dihydrolipoyllysine-residue succinyltransferase [Legionellales bacterium]|nr:dihydrolipoyllysine-residue succinyltransferase [Legionellales bacterium]